MTHELLKCGYGRRKTAQKLLLEAAKIDCSKQEIDEKIGSKELSKEITAGMIAFTNRILSKNNYPAENISRRILIQLGIQEEVKKLISSNNKFLAAYLTRDTENGRKGYTPNVIGYVYNAIHDNADYSVLALEDLKYVVKMGCDEQLNEIEGQEMIKAGIKIITDKAYKPIEYGPFVSAYMAQRKAISYVQMLKYLKNLNDDRKKFDEVYSNLQHEEQKE